MTIHCAQTATDTMGVLLIPAEITKKLDNAFDTAYESYHHQPGGIAHLQGQLKSARSRPDSVGALLLTVGRECLAHH